MSGWRFLLVAAVALPLLAGCMEGAPPDGAEPRLAAVPAAALQDGGFYAFQHRGGDLALAAKGGSAEVVLYGADDARLGRIGLGDGQASGRFVLDGVGAGELVVQVLSVNGTLEMRSSGSPVAAFERLPTHVERHVLVQRPLGPLSFVGVPGVDPNPADEAVALQLLRTPSSLRLLLQGSFQDLEVRLSGREGTILEARHPGGPIQPVVGPFALGEVPSETHDENVRDSEVGGRVTASHFEGVLLLESESFSRAKPVATLAGAVTAEEPRFTFGVLPDQPVSFQVREGSQWLYLFDEGSGSSAAGPSEACEAQANSSSGRPAQACGGTAAIVALFGPRDERVATVAVPAGRTIGIPVHADGDWVAVLLSGTATLGADQVPSDFELHPLDVRTVTAPLSPASPSNGAYGQATEEVRPSGVAFRVHATDDVPRGSVGEPFLLGPAQCGFATVILLRDGETIGSWGFQPEGSPSPKDPLGMDAQASGLLGDGGLTLVHDDFGPDCDRLALAVDGYTR